MKQRFITTVALDEETAELANQIPNFSEWVRSQIRQEAGKAGVGTHSQDPKHRVRGKCNPMGKNPCRVCWPEGAPSKDDWLMFREGLIDEIDTSYQQRMKHFTQQAFTNNVAEKKSGQAVSNDLEVEIGWIRRFWRKVF
jgi:hypothetical protein